MSTAAVLSRPVRRTLAVGLLLAAAAAALAWLVAPLLRWSYESCERLADARFELTRAQRAAQSAASTSAPDEAAREEQLDGWLLAGGGEADAQAGLQERVSSLLGGEGLVVEHTAAAPAADNGTLRRLAVDWRGSGSEAALVKAIAALERGRPLVRLERLRIASPGADGAAAPPRLSVEMRLVAFWAAPAAVAAAQGRR